jgi:peptide/nickel transport system permease protein
VQGDFGEDKPAASVRPQLVRALQVTLRLVVVAIVIAVVIALLVGVTSALRQYSAFDYASTFGAFLSSPSRCSGSRAC